MTTKPAKKSATAENRTAVIIGTGVSLVSEDIAKIRELDPNAYFIAISDSYQLIPDADIIYSADFKWWAWHNDRIDALGCKGQRVTLDVAAAKWYGLKLLPCADLDAPRPGLHETTDAVRHGFSSGFQAVHMARNLGFKKIVLLGMDYGATGQSHWFGSHPDNSISDFDTMLAAFDEIAEPLKKENVSVINCTRETNLRAFPRKSLEKAFA